MLSERYSENNSREKGCHKGRNRPGVLVKKGRKRDRAPRGKIRSLREGGEKKNPRLENYAGGVRAMKRGRKGACYNTHGSNRKKIDPGPRND